MVVLVNKDVKSIWNLKGKRFCHPGLDTVDKWTKAFSTVNNILNDTLCPINTRAHGYSMHLIRQLVKFYRDTVDDNSKKCYVHGMDKYK